MKTALLDLNLLTALLWPTHEHHEVAHRWFNARRRGRWATCPLTQLGFVRLASNPAFSRDALSPAGALSLLEENLAHPAHEFWPDGVSLPDAARAIENEMQGHRQVTDAYMLALADRRNGSLATFDRAIAVLAGKTLGRVVELIATR